MNQYHIWSDARVSLAVATASTHVHVAAATPLFQLVLLPPTLPLNIVAPLLPASDVATAATNTTTTAVTITSLYRYCSCYCPHYSLPQLPLICLPPLLTLSLPLPRLVFRGCCCLADALSFRCCFYRWSPHCRLSHFWWRPCCCWRPHRLWLRMLWLTAMRLPSGAVAAGPYCGERCFSLPLALLSKHQACRSIISRVRSQELGAARDKETRTA